MRTSDEVSENLKRSRRLCALLFVWALAATLRCTWQCPSCPATPLPCVAPPFPTQPEITQPEITQSEITQSPPQRSQLRRLSEAKAEMDCDPANDNPAERQAMTNLFLSTGGPSTWLNKGAFLDPSLSICCWMPWNGNQGQGIDCFENSRVSTLGLWGNGLTGTADLSAFEKLVGFSLALNRLTSIQGLQNLKWLESISLEHNQLTEVHGLYALYQLNTLHLHNNRLTAFPLIHANNYLTDLTLSDNHLTTAPGLEALRQLNRLILHNNSLSSLPSNMSWATIQDLSLYDNALTALPISWISLPTQLTYLSLFRNQLIELPNWLAELTVLSILDVGHNQLTSIPDFSTSNLGSLSLANNHLSLQMLTGRVYTIPLLDVSGNPLSAPLDYVMGNLSRPQTISSFAAANCSLLSATYTSTPTIFPHLMSLDVHDNTGINDLADIAFQFPILTNLDISRTSWRRGIEFPQLRYLRAEGLPSVIWPTNLARSSTLQLLDATNTQLTTGISSPLDDVETNNAQFVRFPVYNALTCPSWRFKVNKGIFLTDASLGDFRGCFCLEGHYFRRLAPWGCDLCPAYLSCNTSSSPEAMHNITGNVYPVVAIAGNFSGASLVQAKFLPCHFPVCNVAPVVNAGTFVCAEGHDINSLLCSKCESGYFSGRGTCTKCHASYVILVPLALMVILGLFGWYVATRDPTKSGHLVSIVFFWLQLMALLHDSTQAVSSSSSSSSSSSDVRSFQSSGPQSVLQDLASFRPWALECVFGSDYWDFFTNSWCLLLAPFVVPLVIKLWSVLYARYTCGDGLWQYRTLYVWELLYVPVSSRVFALLKCIEEHDYLSSEPWISCSDSSFIALRGFAISVLLVFVLALPVVSVYGVAKDWASFQFMKQSFHAHTWWWQTAVWRVRSLVLVMFVQLLPYDSSFIPIIVWILLLASISLNLLFRPYRLQRDAWLMTALLAMSTIIYQTSIVGPSFANNQGAAVFVQICYAFCLVLVAVAAGWHRLFPKHIQTNQEMPLEDSIYNALSANQ